MVLIQGLDKARGNCILVCRVCGRKVPGIGAALEICPECIRNRWDESRPTLEDIHVQSRASFNLPAVVPGSPGGRKCNICFHGCRMARHETGYCSARTGELDSFRHDGRSRALFSHYLDPLPTNCVADWVCSGGTGAGHPNIAHERGPEVGYYNLAVFFESCNFNCLYCQNWSFRKRKEFLRQVSAPELVAAANEETSCVCFFGGDPTPQLPFALRAAKEMIRSRPGRILRICWETNLSMNPVWIKSMARLSLNSGGCIKVDLKAWNGNIHHALCGVGNRQVLQNFARLSNWVTLRPEPPLVIASTVLVPGYINEEEIFRIASFIASFNPDIPYALLGFAPEFCMSDFPTTSQAHADNCLDAAFRAGLKRVRIGNQHFLN